jgi:hypothetical protein
VLTEAECYHRCYGGRDDDTVVVLRKGARAEPETRKVEQGQAEAGAEGREAA